MRGGRRELDLHADCLSLSSVEVCAMFNFDYAKFGANFDEMFGTPAIF